jgi:thiamine-monophosphate kinase
LRSLRSTSLSDEQIITILWKYIGYRSDGRDPFRDDVSWTTPAEKAKFLVSKCDMFVSSTDAPDRMTPRQMAAKSMTACVSDLASKGVRPRFCVLSIGLPRSRANSAFVRGLGSGFASASKLYGVRVLAGDTGSTTSDVTINCSMFGFANHIVKRKGAMSGDCVGVTGKFGLQPAGLLILQGKARSRNRFFSKRAISSVLNPRARLSTGLRLARLLSSSIDSSDGLAISLYYLAEASKVSIELNSIPLAEGVKEFAEENSIDPLSLALFGGEEYEIVSTFPENSKRRVEKLGVGIIGSVKKDRRDKVYHGGREIERKGWIHFVSD